MINLIKYEFRKTWTTKLILLAITAFAEVVFLASLYLDKRDINALSIVALTILAIGGILFIGIQSILTMHQDMNTKQGYMLYMTPNSCYKILGGKVLENGLSMFVAGAFYFALGALDVPLLLGHYGELDKLMEMVKQFMSSMQMEVSLNGRMFALFALSFLCSWLCTVTTAYLADVVATCLLNGKKHNGWIGLLVFILLQTLFSWVERTAVGGRALDVQLIGSAVIAIVASAAMYAATAFLMDRHLSV